MEDSNQTLLAQMADIKGLEDISVFPLAAGWWLVILLFAMAGFIILKKIMAVKKFKASWRYQIQQELDAMAVDTNTSRTKADISRLNDILKRLAIQTYGRQDSASLAGRKWLVWLTDRDPRNFNWVKNGEMLVEYPYAPEEKIKGSAEKIAVLAKAARAWLHV